MHFRHEKGIPKCKVQAGTNRLKIFFLCSLCSSYLQRPLLEANPVALTFCCKT